MKGYSLKPAGSRWGVWAVAILILLAAALGAGYYLWRSVRADGGRTTLLFEYLDDPTAHAGWILRAGSRCGNAPLLFPTDGYVGYVWGSTFQPLHPHQGIDVFGDQPIGRTPVVSVSDGYLTRLPGWKSAVIVRLPDDPLHPGREIWLYYTHMADPEGGSFIEAAWPPGITGKPVKAGELLGYQGNYTGDPQNPSGIHLHFSIVRGDGRGGWLSELDIANTLDPSPYLGLPLNAETAEKNTPVCAPPAGNS